MYEAANEPIFDTTPTQYASLSKREGAKGTHGDMGGYGTGVARTRGHCAGNGGLRGHSVGGVFPCVIFQRGNPESLTHGFRSPDGVEHGGFASYDDAYLAAGIWLDNRPVSFEPQVNV